SIYDEIHRVCQGEVRHGVFRSMKLDRAAAKGSGAIGPKLLGTYEQELAPHIEKLVSGGSIEVVVNIGCGEGYYSVGLARLAPQAHVFAYDANDRAHSVCARNAALNSVSERFTLDRACTPENLDSICKDKKTLIISSESGGIELLAAANGAIGNAS